MNETSLLSQLLESLAPSDASEWSALKMLLGHAEKLRARDASIAFRGSQTQAGWERPMPSPEMDPLAFLSQLPERSARYFHGLMEAMDIYQSIHGEGLLVAGVSPSEKSLREIKQIRDMCLEDGLRSIY